MQLTMLLSPALGGDCKTTVIVCASMEQDDAVETVQVDHLFHINFFCSNGFFLISYVAFALPFA